MSAKQLKSALMSVYDDWPDNVKGAAARGMISYLDAGKYEFSTADLEDDFGIQGYEKSSLLKRLRKEGVVEMTRQGQRCFFYRFCVNEKEARGAQNRVLSEDCTEAEHMSVKNTIAQFAPALKESKFKRAVRALPAFVDRGKYQFTSLDFASELNLRQKDASWFGTCLMKGGLITVVGKAGKAFLYAFCIPESEEAAVISEPPDEEEQELDLKGFFSQSPLLKDSDYSLEILERIRLLRTSKNQGFCPVLVDKDIKRYVRKDKYGFTDSKEDYPKVTKRLIDLAAGNCFSVWMGRLIYNYYLDCDELEDDVENDLNMLIPPDTKEYLDKFAHEVKEKEFILGEDNSHKPYNFSYKNHVFALIPVENPWEVLAWVPMGGFNWCPDELHEKLQIEKRDFTTMPYEDSTAEFSPGGMVLLDMYKDAFYYMEGWALP